MFPFCLHAGRKIFLKAISMVLPVFVIALFAMSMVVAADVAQPTVKIDAQSVLGRWVRPDGGYILELKEIGTDGILKAAYFNPNPIHVYRAELRQHNNAISIFVELRDVNYPGSTYNLLYNPKTDRLTGTYFQAVEKVTYDVEFLKVK